MLRHSASFWKGLSHLYFSFYLARRWSGDGLDRREILQGSLLELEVFCREKVPIHPSEIITRIKSVVVCRRVRCLPSLNCAEVHRGH